MARTFGPTATTSAHASRFDICAVAGITMPPADRRSPSAAPNWTRTRSFSILIGSFSPSLTCGLAIAQRYRGDDVRPHDLAEADDPWASAVLLHPHPDMGGDRHNN